MSILNVLLRPDQLFVAVDTLAEDARTGAHSSGAEMLLIPQYNLVLAARGSTQFFLRIYELALQASFRADFTMEQLIKELGLVIDKLWPGYERAAVDAGLPKQSLGTELVLGGWSPKSGRMVATVYAKNDSTTPAIVQQLDGALLRQVNHYEAARTVLRHRTSSLQQGFRRTTSMSRWAGESQVAAC